MLPGRQLAALAQGDLSCHITNVHSRRTLKSWMWRAGSLPKLCVARPYCAASSCATWRCGRGAGGSAARFFVASLRKSSSAASRVWTTGRWCHAYSSSSGV